MKVINNISNPNFNAKIDTASVLEATSMKIFKNEGTEGFKRVYNTFVEKPMKATGSRGYAYFAREIGEKIKSKYPEIAQATVEIQEILKTNPNIKKIDLQQKIQPIIDRLGEVIDITL